jgi:branched-chain amino acid transport system substrate-binding protein
VNGIVYTDPELEPNTSLPAVQQVYAAVRASGGTKISNINLGGWLAAQALVHAIQSINGDVTRTSVSQALKKLTSYPNPFTGSPFAFGPGSRHLSNQTIKEAVIRNGQWQVLTKNWIKVPGMDQI